MKKRIVILFSLILTLNSFSQVIKNNDIKFILAPNNLQVHNTPYKFFIEHKIERPIGEPEKIPGILYYEGVIYNDNNSYINIGIPYSSPDSYSVNIYASKTKETINNKDIYTYRSKLIDLKDIGVLGNTYPLGNYKFSILGILWNKSPAVNYDTNGDPETGITNGVKRFNINDICINCNNGIFIDTDSDGDGVYDNQDDCPNEAGNVSNNGCPGNPDLIIDEQKSTVIVPSSSSTVSISTNTIFNVYANDELQVFLKIDNKGKVASGNTKVGFFISTTNKIEDAGLIKEINLSNVTPNFSQTRNISFSNWDLSSTYGILGNAYLHIKLDNNNDIYEGSDGENNNEFSSIKLNIRNTHRRSKGKIKLISIRNINGQLIRNNVLIENKQEEIDLIKSLSRGLYFMDKNGKKSQLYKN